MWEQMIEAINWKEWASNEEWFLKKWSALHNCEDNVYLFSGKDVESMIDFVIFNLDSFELTCKIFNLLSFYRLEEYTSFDFLSWLKTFESFILWRGVNRREERRKCEWNCQNILKWGKKRVSIFNSLAIGSSNLEVMWPLALSFGCLSHSISSHFQSSFSVSLLTQFLVEFKSGAGRLQSVWIHLHD